MSAPAQITLDNWQRRRDEVLAEGYAEPWYGGPLARHAEDDLRLQHLLFDNSAASLRLWNFLLTEEERLFEAKSRVRRSSAR